MSTSRDAGFVSAVEIVYLGIVVLAAIFFLGYLGRLGAAGVQVTNAAQDAARAASLQADADTAGSAAQQALARSGLTERCRTAPTATLQWVPEQPGQWPGSVVSVTVSCEVSNASLSGVWTPGVRTVTVTDAQIVERFRR